MASNELIRAVNSYEQFIKQHGISEEAVNAYVEACRTAYLIENDPLYGIQISKACKGHIEDLIYASTMGGNFRALEEWAQKTKQEVTLIQQYYEMLKLESPYIIDSFKLYIEKNRPRAERFYEPRRRTLIQISNAIQDIEDDKLDVLFLHMPPRVGKLLADETPVFTSDGWKKHGDLVVGDKVIGSDGKFTEVVKVFPKNFANMKVTLSNGEVIYCHENHEWTVYDRYAQRWHTYETHEMLQRLIRNDKKNGVSRKRFNLYMPITKPMEGTYREFELHPYVLGAWLGDGTSTKPWITDPESDYAIVQKIIDCGYGLRKTYTHKTSGVKSFVFESKLSKDLQKYDMCHWENTAEKYIPMEYLTSSIEQRLELLAGLIDTDGCLVRKENRYNFTTTSEKIRDGFITLVSSFGWRTCVVEYEPHTSSFGIVGKKKYWVIAFNPTIEIPCVLERKKLKNFSKQRRISIVSIEPCKERPGNCISVANSDGLYAVGNTMQLTHNSGDVTMDVSWHCARDTEKSNLYVTYKEGLGGAFLDGVMEIYTDPTYCFGDVFPNVVIVDTDAKNHKIDLCRKKKYKSLSGKGLESGLNGEYDANGWLVVDDPLEGVQDVMSKEVLKRKQTIFDNNVLSRKKEKCKLILIGTLWSLNDLFGNYLEFIESSGTNLRYRVIRIPALDENEHSNFEYDYGVGFSTQYYLSQRAKHEMNSDLAGWQAQYMQNPIERDGAVFNPEMMKYYDVLPDKKPLKVLAYCDCALGGGDFLSFPIAYYFENDDGTIDGYIEDVVFDNSEKHITQPQVIAAIKKHKIRHAKFESNQGGEGYKDDIERMIKEDEEYTEPFNVSSAWSYSRKSKEQRIWDFAEDIRHFYFKDANHRTEQYSKFMRNLFSFTMIQRRRSHDDAPDSLAGLVEFEREGATRKKTKIIRSPF